VGVVSQTCLATPALGVIVNIAVKVKDRQPIEEQATHNEIIYDIRLYAGRGLEHEKNTLILSVLGKFGCR
jgi:hypothetical protein